MKKVLDKILRSSEGKTLEFKRDTSALKQIMRTIVAFANTAGGIIVIGRDDNGSIVGVEDPLQLEEQLTNSIADSIAPMLMPNIEIVSVESKSLLCVRVAHWSGPFYLKSEGNERGVYIRLGSSTRQAGPHPLTLVPLARLGAADVPANVPINVPVNIRQQWFLDQLRQGIPCRSANIAAKWGVVEKTAKRDISDLQKKNLIVVVGPAKTGTYQLK